MKYISIVGASLLHGIARLAESLLRCLEREAISKFREASPRHDENAYSVSICVLIVASVESAVTRFRYLSEGLEFTPGSAFNWLGESFPEKKVVADELAFIRGSILHNHLYELEQAHDDGTFDLENIKKRHASGDGKYEKLADADTQRTRLLKINVIPSQVRMSDAIRVLNASLDLIGIMEEKSDGRLSFVDTHVELNGKSGLTLERLISQLTERLLAYDPLYASDLV